MSRKERLRDEMEAMRRQFQRWEGDVGSAEVQGTAFNVVYLFEAKVDSTPVASYCSRLPY